MKSTSDILKKLTLGIKKTLWILGLHAFLLILFLVFVDFILGGFIFYKYVFLAKKEEYKVTENIIKFDAKTYQDVLRRLQENEQSNKSVSTVDQSVASE